MLLSSANVQRLTLHNIHQFNKQPILVKPAPRVTLLTSWTVELANPHYCGFPKNTPVNSASLWVQISLDIWIQPMYLGMCYYQSSQDPLPTLPALPLWEGSSVRRAGVQFLSVWGVWRMLSWSCEPPDSLVYCLMELRGGRVKERKRKSEEKKDISLSITCAYLDNPYITAILLLLCTFSTLPSFKANLQWNSKQFQWSV